LDLHALGLELLQNLLRGEVVLFQPSFDARLVRIEFAGAIGTLVFVIRVMQPVTDSLLVQLKFACNLSDGEFFILVQRVDLPIGQIIDHGPPSMIRRKISATGLDCSERAVGSATPPASKGNSREST